MTAFECKSLLAHFHPPSTKGLTSNINHNTESRLWNWKGKGNLGERGEESKLTGVERVYFSEDEVVLDV